MLLLLAQVAYGHLKKAQLSKAYLKLNGRWVLIDGLIKPSFYKRMYSSN